MIGEAPNIAARLQSLAGRNGIVIGALTKEIAGDAFVYQDLGAHELKGIAGLVKAWAVTGLRAEEAEDGRRERGGVRPAPAALVGRDEEIGLLRRAWQQHQGRGPRPGRADRRRGRDRQERAGRDAAGPGP